MFAINTPSPLALRSLNREDTDKCTLTIPYPYCMYTPFCFLQDDGRLIYYRDWNSIYTVCIKIPFKGVKPIISVFGVALINLIKKVT